MTDFSDDEVLMTALRDAIADGDAVTDRRREAARAAFSWRTVDVELMELLHDSALEAGAAVRGEGDARHLTFGRDGLTVELEVSGGVLHGQVLPAQGADLVLQRHDAGGSTLQADSAGFFRVDGVAAGPIRLVVAAAGIRVATPWVTL
jgi:hypothetical protein